ncbi:MAG: hypothetical protein GY773_02110, partial [Actinomycetia bacterium]|nr:hypothetical protein [Actinomycetes bacterium]
MRRLLTVLMVSTLAILAAATPAGAKPKVTQLTVAGPWPVGTAEADALEAELAWFGARKRVEVTYEEYVGVVDLVERVTGPNPPDLIISPQPGTLEALAPELVDLGDYVKQRRLQRRFSNYM